MTNLILIIFGILLFTFAWMISSNRRGNQITGGLDTLIQKQDDFNNRLDQTDQRLVQLHLELERLEEKINDKLDDHQKCIRYLLQQNSLNECEKIFQEKSTLTSKKAKKAKKSI